jgi:uroporphyrin-3 C-methyltransferase
MDESFEFLRSVFVWRRLDEPAQALVAARLGGARELKLILEQAKLALLAGDEILFDRQLDSARLWIERNGKQDMASVDAVLTELDQLKGIALQPRLPLIGGALRGVAELNASTRL